MVLFVCYFVLLTIFSVLGGLHRLHGRRTLSGLGQHGDGCGLHDRAVGCLDAFGAHHRPFLARTAGGLTHGPAGKAKPLRAGAMPRGPLRIRQSVTEWRERRGSNPRPSA